MVGQLRARFSTLSLPMLQLLLCVVDSPPMSISMEVDSSAIDERKEGGNTALLQVDEQPDGSPSDSPSQSSDGQTQISR